MDIVFYVIIAIITCGIIHSQDDDPTLWLWGGFFWPLTFLACIALTIFWVGRKIGGLLFWLLRKLPE